MLGGIARRIAGRACQYLVPSPLLDWVQFKRLHSCPRALIISRLFLAVHCGNKIIPYKNMYKRNLGFVVNKTLDLDPHPVKRNDLLRVD